MAKNKADKESKQKTDENVGIKAVLEQSLQSYEKLPMLEIIFEKFILHLSTALRNLSAETVNISITEFNSIRFGNYFKNIKIPYSIVVFKAIEWENFGLLILDNSMIFAFVDLLLGGKNSTNSKDKDPDRILTSIEQGLARQISEVILTSLSNSFDQISPITFSFEELESNPSFITIARPGDAIISLKLKVEINDMVKSLELVIPYKTIEPIKEQMQQVFLGDEFGYDDEWEKFLLKNLQDIDLPLEAVINNKVSTIEDVANLKIGDTIIMNHSKEKDITLHSGAVPLFTGKIGKVDNKFAINLKKIIEK
ncbi:MAG: FliM/FliN family flagellar motor switch protein [Rickettsiaceae bacterium]|nr:FliM/FliN family flagellar motor switch protein [Rickettsiaceae bacterium]